MMTPLLRRILFAVSLLAGVSALAADLPFDKFEATAVQDNGRRKPYRTFATESLQTLSGKTTFTRPGETAKSNAMNVVTSLWVEPEAWAAYPLIRVNYKPLREALGLPLAEKWFSYEALTGNPKLLAMLEQITAAQRLPKPPKLSAVDKEARDLGNRLLLFEALTSGQALAIIPSATANEGRWQPVSQNASEELVRDFQEFGASFRRHDPAAFARASSVFSAALQAVNPAAYPSAGTVQTELFYSKLHPFRWAWILYLLAAITLGLTALLAPRIGYAIAWLAVGTGFAFQVTGFVCRIIISGRAPVTNMYESVVWVAFGTVLFGIILEAIYRCRYFLIGATLPATIALILADTQTGILDSSIHPLQPVLRDNFWLSTHVTSITLSYAAFLLALGVAHLILIKTLAGGRVTGALHNYLYRALQIGVLLLAIGTILGGVWANYSWGRFWDWDPKETWALIALLGYLFLLHGRLVGWWTGFGLAIGAILAFQSVVMAWYGVNFVLGVGLHSYGFGTGGFPFMAAFCGAELLFVAFVCLKAASSRAQPKPAAVAAAPIAPTQQARAGSGAP